MRLLKCQRACCESGPEQSAADLTPCSRHCLELVPKISARAGRAPWVPPAAEGTRQRFQAALPGGSITMDRDGEVGRDQRLCGESGGLCRLGGRSHRLPAPGRDRHLPAPHPPPPPPPPGGGTLRVAATSTGQPCPWVTERAGLCRTGRALRSRTGAGGPGRGGAARGAERDGRCPRCSGAREPPSPPGHGGPRRRPGGGRLQRRPAPQGTAGDGDGDGDEGTAEGAAKRGEGAGLLLELPNKSRFSAFLTPRLPVGSVCHPVPVRGGGVRRRLSPPCGDGQPAGIGPGPSHIPSDGRQGGGRIQHVWEAGTAGTGPAPRHSPLSPLSPSRCPVQDQGGSGQLNSGALFARSRLMTRDFPAMKYPCLRDVHSCPRCFEILFCSVPGTVFCNCNCTEGDQGWWCPCKTWGAQALLRGQQQQGFLLSAVRRCPATPGVMEEMLIYDRSTAGLLPAVLTLLFCSPQ